MGRPRVGRDVLLAVPRHGVPERRGRQNLEQGVADGLGVGGLHQQPVVQRRQDVDGAAVFRRDARHPVRRGLDHRQAKGLLQGHVDEDAARRQRQAVDVGDVGLRVVLGEGHRAPEAVVVDEPKDCLDDGPRPGGQRLERVPVAHHQHQIGELAQGAVARKGLDERREVLLGVGAGHGQDRRLARVFQEGEDVPPDRRVLLLLLLVGRGRGGGAVFVGVVVVVVVVGEARGDEATGRRGARSGVQGFVDSTLGAAARVAAGGARGEQRLNSVRLWLGSSSLARRRRRRRRRVSCSSCSRSCRRRSSQSPSSSSNSSCRSSSSSSEPLGQIHAPQRREVEPRRDHRHRRHRPPRPRPRRQHRRQFRVVGVVQAPLVVDLLARRGQDHDGGLERALLGLDAARDAVGGLDLGAGHGSRGEEVLELVAAEGVAWILVFLRGAEGGGVGKKEKRRRGRERESEFEEMREEKRV